MKQSLHRDFETNTKSNSYLLTQIGLKYQYVEDPVAPATSAASEASIDTYSGLTIALNWATGLKK